MGQPSKKEKTEWSLNEQTLTTRLHRMSQKLRELTSGLKPMTYSDIAREILNHQHARPNLTLDVERYKTKDPFQKSDRRLGFIKLDGWALIHPPDPDDDDATEGHITYHDSEDDARATLQQAWGPIDQSLEHVVLQPAILQVPSRVADIEAERKVENLEATLRRLEDYAQADSSMGTVFPRNYADKTSFDQDVLAHQRRQLETINRLVHTADFIVDVDGKKTIRDEESWNLLGPNRPDYPKLPDFKGVSITQDIQLQTLLAIEDYLFYKASEPVLVTLARAHAILGPASNVEGPRQPLTSETDLGSTEGQALLPIIETMAVKGYDITPVFDQDSRCVGSLSLQNLVLSLQKYGIDALPKTVNIPQLRKLGLLGPAPVMVDAHESKARVAELLSGGLLAVIVEYIPEMWQDHEEFETVDEHLLRGKHIVTQHDLVIRSLTVNTPSEP